MLYEFDKLFENRREAFVVATLSVNGPMRFTELGFHVSNHVRVRVPDSTITRILVRLMHRGLVELVHNNDHDAYQLTDDGKSTAWVIEKITHALDGYDAAQQSQKHKGDEPSEAA